MKTKDAFKFLNNSENIFNCKECPLKDGKDKALGNSCSDKLCWIKVRTEK